MKSWTLSRMFSPVTPIEDVLKNGSSDNAPSLVWAQSVTKQQRVHCWCCISAGTITLFSRPQRGCLNWTTPPSHRLNSHRMQPSTPPRPTPFPSPPLHPSLLSSQPTHPPATHSSHARIPWSPVLIWVETFWALAWGGGEGGRWVDTREAGGEAASTRSSFLIRTCLEFRPLSCWRACLFTVLLLSTLSWALVASSRSSDQSAAPIGACCSV